jgi:hypothetical protein
MRRLSIYDLPLKDRNRFRNDEKKRKAKYNSVRTKINGYCFSSKKEAKRYLELLTLKKAGEIKIFIRQPMIDLGGGTTYRPDFLIFWSDGKTTWEDVKGFKTPIFKMKKKLVEAKYPIDIEIV